MSHDPAASHRPQPRPHRHGPNEAQWTVALLILVFGLLVVGYRGLHAMRLEQTAALYIGLPTVLALLLTLAPRAASLYGMVLRATTIGLLLSVLLLGEGFICVLLAAPLIYAVALLVTAAVETARRPPGRGPRAGAMVVLPLLLLTATEGVVPATTLPADGTASVTRVLNVPARAVEDALGRPLDLQRVPLRGLLALGFPEPVGMHGGGLQPGDRHEVMFAGAGPRVPFVAAHHWGTGRSHLVLEVVTHRPGMLAMRPVADTTPIASWVRWTGSQVRWTPVGPDRTAVTWTLDYERRLAPAWYFGPMERYAAGRAANHLIDSLPLPPGSATP